MKTGLTYIVLVGVLSFMAVYVLLASFITPESIDEDTAALTPYGWIFK